MTCVKRISAIPSREYKQTPNMSLNTVAFIYKETPGVNFGKNVMETYVFKNLF